jgi:pimeloyl-ACP methyl ester carboxylesterase
MSAPHAFTVAHDGIGMHVLAAGKGVPVLLVHGFGSSSDTWYFNTKPLSQRFRVYAMDLPGFGRSSKVAPPGFLPFYAEWLLRLLDLNGHAKAHLVGSSMGGAICLQFALSYPGRLDRLTLVDPVGLGMEAGGEILRAIVDARTEEDVRAAYASCVHDASLPTPEAVQRIFGVRQQPGAVGALRDVGSQLFRDCEFLVDFRSRLAEIGARTLVVWGREDRVVPVSHLNAASDMPRVQTHIFESCGHVPHFEVSEAFNTLLFEFLTSP